MSYSLLRSATFAAEGSLLPLLDRLGGNRRSTPKDYVAHLQVAIPKIQRLLKDDADNIARGLYPIDVLRPENPLGHALRLPKILADAVRASKQRKENDAKRFTGEAAELAAEVPDYYARNFHFQKGGYLDDDSADLYEHQVEVLFAGAADAMRRLILPALKEAFPGDGAGLKFLDVGCGTGRLSRFVALAFPKAQVTCLDLSGPYLVKARHELSNLKRVDFVRGRAEDLPFKESTFDAVFSCFLFHELPENVRDAAIAEGRRVLKSGGVYGIVDSLQSGDDPELEWALTQFPVDFHEPFYKNYTQRPLEAALAEAGFTNAATRIGFLTKAVTARKES